MKKLILFFTSIAFVACSNDDDNAALIDRYKQGNKSSYFKYYWEYAGPYKNSGSDMFFPPDLNLGNGVLDHGDVLYFGDEYLETYDFYEGNYSLRFKDLWYNEKGILNVMNLNGLVDDKYLEINFQKRFPYLRHESNDTILLLDNGVNFYLLRRDSL